MIVEVSEMTIHPVRAGMVLAITFAVLYIACGLIVLVAPDFFFGIAASWAHSVALTQGGVMTFGSFLYGLVTFSLFGFVMGVLFAAVWNMQTPATHS